jgi:DNA-directed RNA polymerase subunit alpha
MSVHELELSVRANNCLEGAKIETVGELVRLAEADLLKIRSFGKTSLREVKRRLVDLGLSLGMAVPAAEAEAAAPKGPAPS